MIYGSVFIHLCGALFAVLCTVLSGGPHTTIRHLDVNNNRKRFSGKFANRVVYIYEINHRGLFTTIVLIYTVINYIQCWNGILDDRTCPKWFRFWPKFGFVSRWTHNISIITCLYIMDIFPNNYVIRMYD